MLWVDTKYVGLLSFRLRNFKQKNQNYWNFSCPICGDSKKDPRKARGYVLLHKGGLIYKCHNCGLSCSLANLLKRVDPTLHSEYTVEVYKEKVSSNPEIAQELLSPPPKKLNVDNILANAQNINDLPITHPALSYVIKRKIPKSKWDRLYFVPKFKQFTNSVKNTFINENDDHPRLIIPFFTEEGKVFAFQARAFGNETPKYYTIKLDEEKEKIYGLERIDTKNRVYVVEGPIDSLFLPNAIAVTGSSFDTPIVRGMVDVATIIVDNEPRNNEVMKQLQKYIDIGYSVCIWPDEIKEKDINEMILSGKSTNEIKEIIDQHTYQGLTAQVKFNQWRKCAS